MYCNSPPFCLDCLGTTWNIGHKGRQMPKRRDESTGAIVALPPKRVRGGKRKGGGAKLVRSETVTVRLDPKLRYLGEIAARKQRRTVSSFIEWAIEDVLRRVSIEE